MPAVKEYNVDAYVRKFMNTLTMVDVKGKPVPIFVSNIAEDANGDMKFFDGERVAWPMTPIYHHFKAGYYQSKVSTAWYCISRRLRNSFHIGLSSDNHVFKKFAEGDWVGGPAGLPKFSMLLLDQKPDPQKSIDKEGPISERLFVSQEKIFYLTIPIGFRVEHQFYLADNALHQEVSDALRGLTHKGQKCEVLSM